MGPSGQVNLTTAIHKVLSGEWLFARNINTRLVIGLNKSFMSARGIDFNRLPINVLVKANGISDGPIYTEFKFYCGDSYNEEWIGCNENVYYTLDPL